MATRRAAASRGKTKLLIGMSVLLLVFARAEKEGGMTRVLLLGGTGAMGSALAPLLAGRGCSVSVTSRKKREPGEVRFIQGDAQDGGFLSSLFESGGAKWDAVVDFMSRTKENADAAFRAILPHTGRYVFISSARVYAKSDAPITEDSPRLLDVCGDAEYLATDEYALAKAREEDMLYKSGFRNWTVVRPTLTYNDARLQYALGEKEDWLFRALSGRSVVMPRDMENTGTTLVFAGDVARAISLLLESGRAAGETFHTAGGGTVTWGDVLKIYADTLSDCGVPMKVRYVENALEVAERLGNRWQIKYARGIDRSFSPAKLEEVAGKFRFTPAREGLSRCLKNFLQKPEFAPASWRRQAVFDRISGERTPLREFATLKQKLAYTASRYAPRILSWAGR